MRAADGAEVAANRAPGRRPRIAITGSAGVGKTTLVQALAGRLDLPVVEEGMRRRLEAGLDVHALGRDGLRTLLIELFDEMLADTRHALDHAGGFVSDRSAFDVGAFWLFYGFGCDRAATDALMARVNAAAALYDVIVVLPWGSVPLRDDRIRTANPWLQLHYQTVIEGLVARGPVATVRVAADCSDLESRIGVVASALGR